MTDYVARTLMIDSDQARALIRAINELTTDGRCDDAVASTASVLRETIRAMFDEPCRCCGSRIDVWPK